MTRYHANGTPGIPVWANGIPVGPSQEPTPDELSQQRDRVMCQFPYAGYGLGLGGDLVFLDKECRAVQSLVADGLLKEHPTLVHDDRYSKRFYYRTFSPDFWTVLRVAGHTFNFSMLASYLTTLDLWVPWRWLLAWVGVVPLLLNVLVMAAVIALGAALMKIPVLGWGWMSIFSRKGTAGNAATATVGAPGIVGTGYSVLLLIVLPALAQWEEEIFRGGTSSIGDVVFRSILFGLAHALMGIPLGGAIALIVAGFYFAAWYHVGGIEASTGAHAAWNVLLVLVLMTCQLTLWILSKVEAYYQKRVAVLSVEPEQRAEESK